MFIAMNRFRIHPNFAVAFEEKWTKRESHLDENPGFLRFKLLKARLPAGQPSLEYVSHTEWIDQVSFEGWMNGEGARRAHAQSAALPKEAYMGPPEFRGYEVLLDEMPGELTDYRSAAMDTLVEKHFAHESEAQKQIRDSHEALGLPAINIGAFEGRLIEILLRSNGSKRGVEVGTLGGYSSSWLAKALPEDGRLITIEKEPERAKLARQNLDRAGVGSKVEIKVGAGIEVLQSLKELKDLDFVFIDADKANYGNYVRWALPRLRKGGLLLGDNAYIWGGMHYYGREASEIPPRESGGRFDFGTDTFLGMSDCWRELERHPEFASIILPTGEGLAVGIKL